MVIFSKTPRTALNLAMTGGNSLPFDKDQLTRLQRQNLEFAISNIANQRNREALKEKKEFLKRQTLVSSQFDTVKVKSRAINLQFADKISKIIPYSLIPVVAIGAGYLLLKGRK